MENNDLAMIVIDNANKYRKACSRYTPNEKDIHNDHVDITAMNAIEGRKEPEDYALGLVE